MKTREEIEAAVDFLNGSEGSEEALPPDFPDVQDRFEAMNILSWVLECDD